MSDELPRLNPWMRYVWLINLGWLGLQPVFDPRAGIVDWLVVAGLIGLFIPLYMAASSCEDDRRLMLVVAGMAGLGVVGTIWNSGASVFVIFAAASAAYLEPMRRAIRTIAALVGVIGLIVLLSPIPLPWRFVAYAPSLIFTIMIGLANVFEAERDRAQRRLLRADEEIERLATLAERERIARDLHDLLGHTLSVIVVKSELAARLSLDDPARAAEEMSDVERIGREALTEVRAAVAGYRARGLRGELEGARRALEAAGVDATITAELPPLSIAQESALALALREAVTNVVRHARARHATIRIGADGERVLLEVSDDGRGSSAPEGAGLTGMRERIAALGGGVMHDTSTAGTRLRVTLHLDTDATARATAPSPQRP